MHRRLFCELSPLAYRISVEKSCALRTLRGGFSAERFPKLRLEAPLPALVCRHNSLIRRTLGSNFCRRCNYCAPCTVGIAIPSVFLFEGYLSRYGLEDWARARYATLPVKASACIECGACEPRCPYQLPIREMMRKSAMEFGV